MKVKLDNKHYLNCDGYCFWVTVLVKPTAKSKSKEPYERRCSGYTGTFEQAVDSYIEMKIKTAEIEDYTKLVKTINDLKKEVRGWKANIPRKK